MTADTIRIRAFREEDRTGLKRLTAASFGGVSLDQCIEQQFGELNGTTWEERKANHIGQHLYPKMGFVEVARQVHYVREL